MKTPRVLLIYPPSQLMDIEIPRPDGSLGLLYLAGALRRVDVEVDVLDASVGTAEDNLEETFYKPVMQPNGLIRIGMSAERIREVVAKGGYNVVGINSNFTPQTRMALEVAVLVKAISTEILVIVGGVNARSSIPRFLNSGWVDIVCTTEGEKVIVEVIRKWSRGQSFSDVAGIAFKSDNGFAVNPPQSDTICLNLDELPFPAWDLLSLEKYERVASPHEGTSSPSEWRKLRYAPIMTSRGCPFRCSYCHISTEKADSKLTGGIGALRLKSVERVMAEIEVLRSLGVHRLYFEDDSLLAKKSRVMAIFKRVTNLGFSIADINGVNLVHFLVKKSGGRFEIDRDYLELLKAAGFSHIVFPVESASQRILNKYATAKLNHKQLDVVELVRVATDIGITCPINMMIGFPDETESEILQSVELGKRLVDAGAYYCTFFIPIPFPGSQLYDIAIRDGHLNPDFNPDIMNWKHPVMKNTAVSPERLVELREWAWRYVNRKDYVDAMVKSNVHSRWRSGAPEVV